MDTTDLVRRQFDSWWGASKYCQVGWGHGEQVAWDAWQAAIERLSAPAEPVAWKHKSKLMFGIGAVPAGVRPDDWIPLYAHPAAPAEPLAWLLDAAWGKSVSLDKPDIGKAEWKAPAPQIIPLYAHPAAPAPDSKDAARLDWLAANLFEHRWGGTIGQASEWFVAGNYRHRTRAMRGETFRAAIDAAMEQK